jgi:hypothetical protein
VVHDHSCVDAGLEYWHERWDYKPILNHLKQGEPVRESFLVAEPLLVAAATAVNWRPSLERIKLIQQPEHHGIFT